ncbi:hypothetical protein [Acetobacter senegalensis]|uniref:hypothetical protein n=1 Tax=Acetobacter senegalensis TaxID=446692 RepID=UPI001EDC0050|nr:hypothetical protein [Acetobacter senegalensis]MCG4256892.1 hypothetical protein [Acetobacter senegalensis]MCG4266970.1 hypothetical protein [Acetobacter senegalensis]
MSTYIIRISDNSYDLVGPFDNHESAGEWGRMDQERRNDDPRWQTVDLENPEAAPSVVEPDPINR